MATSEGFHTVARPPVRKKNWTRGKWGSLVELTEGFPVSGIEFQRYPTIDALRSQLQEERQDVEDHIHRALLLRLTNPWSEVTNFELLVNRKLEDPLQLRPPLPSKPPKSRPNTAHQSARTPTPQLSPKRAAYYDRLAKPTIFARRAAYAKAYPPPPRRKGPVDIARIAQLAEPRRKRYLRFFHQHNDPRFVQQKSKYRSHQKDEIFSEEVTDASEAENHVVTAVIVGPPETNGVRPLFEMSLSEKSLKGDHSQPPMIGIDSSEAGYIVRMETAIAQTEQNEPNASTPFPEPEPTQLQADAPDITSAQQQYDFTPKGNSGFDTVGTAAIDGFDQFFDTTSGKESQEREATDKADVPALEDHSQSKHASVQGSRRTSADQLLSDSVFAQRIGLQGAPTRKPTGFYLQPERRFFTSSVTEVEQKELD
ncbi:hypothetical protein HK102_000481 [Quaeritorhiza haematococci]|nr:hypothetical protein HK102_000481 [Quaeritorhiza haematococci]